MPIDTHAHLNFNAYRDDADEVIRQSLENNIWMINVGSQYETSKKAIEIAEKYQEGVYAAVGLHPIHLGTSLVKIKNDTEEIEVKIREEESKSINSFPPSFLHSRNSVFDYEKYKELANSEKVVAIGECGFDYYYKPKTKRKLEFFKEKQRTVLCQQLNLAKELKLPVIFHCRMAHQDLTQFLRENEAMRPKNAVIHGFVGAPNELKAYLDFGYYIGFNGIIFKNIEGINFEENIKNTPLDKTLIETDCPYLTPPISLNQHLNQHKSVVLRNEPLYVKYVAERIAKIKNLSYEEIAKATTQNAKKLFKLQ